MENGELLAADVLPKVAKEMKKVAAVGLEDKLDTLRVAQGQFFNELQKAGDTIFQGGFADSLKELFFTVGEFLKENEHALKSLGKVFGLLFNLINIVAKALLPIIGTVTSVAGTLADALNSVFGNEASQDVLAFALGIGAITGAVYGLVKANKLLNGVLKTQLATRTLLLLANPAAWPLLATAGLAVGGLAGVTALRSKLNGTDTNESVGSQRPSQSFMNFMGNTFSDFADAPTSKKENVVKVSIQTEDGLEGRIISTVENLNSNARVEVV